MVGPEAIQRIDGPLGSMLGREECENGRAIEGNEEGSRTEIIMKSEESESC